MPQYVSVSREKNFIHDVGYDSNGKKYKRKVKFRPSCYIESNNPNCDIRTIYGQATQKIEFDSIQDYQKYVSTHKTIAQGTIDPCIQYIHESYSDNDILLKPNIVIVDIEVYSKSEFPNPSEAKYPINSLALYDVKKDLYFCLSLKDYDKTKNTIDIDPTKIKFKKCETEQELLHLIIKIVNNLDIDYLVGYYSHGFDFPYIINRIINVLGRNEADKLSPYGSVSCREIQKKNKVTQSYETYYINQIDGIVLLDYLELYKKYIFTPRESYSLDFICKEELGEGKVDYSQYDNLRQLWEQNPQLYIDYNIVDTVLIKELDDKLGLIELNTTIAYKGKCNIFETTSPMKVWESYLYNFMLDSKMCLPIRKKHESERYPGAYVKEPEAKLYDWLVSFDLASLYPHIMIQYNISPETFIENLTLDVNQDEIDSCFFEKDFKNDKEFILTGSGNYFRKDKEGIVSKIIKTLYAERKETKRQELEYKQKYEDTKNNDLKSKISHCHNIQMAIKILLNSLYGLMANKHFIFYDIRFARSITLSAQLSTKWIEKYILESEIGTKFGIESCYIDTDSCFLHLYSFINKLIENNKIENNEQKITDFIDKFSKDRIQPIIDNGYKILAERMNCDNHMTMKREKICASGMWTGKKRYALNLIDDEGVRYKESKLKVTGIEIVRSSTPACVKPYLKESLVKILKKENIVDYIKDCKKQYYKLNVEQLAFPRSASNFSKWENNNKGIPIGVRAAMTFNEYLEKNNLLGEYEKINSGDKIKFLYMKMPNIVGQDVCGFLRRFPKELHKYVDKEMMWEKSFMSVVRSMCEKIGIEYEESKSINGLF